MKYSKNNKKLQHFHGANCIDQENGVPSILYFISIGTVKFHIKYLKCGTFPKGWLALAQPALTALPLVCLNKAPNGTTMFT